MAFALAASMPSLSRVASRLLASNQSLASSSRVLNTMSSTTLGTNRMLLIRLSSEVQLHNLSPFKSRFSFALRTIGIIFLFINSHRA
jgi:hypothetical protein